MNTNNIGFYNEIGKLSFNYHQISSNMRIISSSGTHEPCCEKTGLRGFRPGPTQTGLYSHTRWLEA